MILKYLLFLMWCSIFIALTRSTDNANIQRFFTRNGCKGAGNMKNHIQETARRL